MEETIKTIIETTINETIKNSHLFAYDWITMIISIIAIVISILVAIWTAKKSNKSTYKNMLYTDVLEDDMFVKLPQIINECVDINSKTINDDKVNEFGLYIIDLKKKILVYKYVDEKFYKQIDADLTEIDENMVLIDNKKNTFQKIMKN